MATTVARESSTPDAERREGRVMPPSWAQQAHALWARDETRAVAARATQSSRPFQYFLAMFIVGVAMLSIDML